MKLVDKDILKDGNVLRVLKDNFKNNPNNETLIPFFRCLLDSTLYVPMYMVNNPISEDKLKDLKVGDTFTLEEGLRLRADYLSGESGQIYFPMFSSENEAPEDYRNRFSVMPMTIEQCLEFAQGKDDCVGMVLDAFTSNLVIKDELSKILKEFIESVKKEEEAK